MHRLITAFANDEALHRICRMLESEGWQPAATCYSGSEVLRQVRNMGSALVICGFKLRDMTVNDLAADLHGTAALMVVSSPRNLDLCDSGDHIYKLPTPCSRADFFGTLELARNFEEKNLYHPPSKRKLEDQTLIRRAKELLMDVNRMTEAEAHRFLQKRSMDAGLRLTETAQLILQSYSQGY